jgi:Asp-tRNA(Asn)/Glu-tRNA(Gln) amidotransferase B subunit
MNQDDDILLLIIIVRLDVPWVQKQVRINRIQLEQDSGKSIHSLDANATHVDLNRAGTGLMEIVFEPDLRSAAEAGQVLRDVQRLLRHIGSCEGNMEDGSIRCDLNVSVRRKEPFDGRDGMTTKMMPQKTAHSPCRFGERVEVKNMNSIRHLMRAVEYEMKRQVVDARTRGSYLSIYIYIYIYNTNAVYVCVCVSMALYYLCSCYEQMKKIHPRRLLRMT